MTFRHSIKDVRHLIWRLESQLTSIKMAVSWNMVDDIPREGKFLALVGMPEEVVRTH